MPNLLQAALLNANNRPFEAQIKFANGAGTSFKSNSISFGPKHAVIATEDGFEIVNDDQIQRVIVHWDDPEPEVEDVVEPDSEA